MIINGVELTRIHENLWEIPMSKGMRVPGRIYTTQSMLENFLAKEDAIKQVVNVAHLPGIEKYSLAMPDIHWGYGFPIGGVAATDINEGVISPGGVGYDINCGVRVVKTSLHHKEISTRITKIIEDLFKSVPTGVGSSGAIKKLCVKELKRILKDGSEWAIDNGFGVEQDLLFTEENGKMEGADPSAVSERAIERGLDQAGTLGSGNHFLEIDVVDEIFNNEIAETFGLFMGQVVIQIHTGSRGLGYQICDDYLQRLVKAEQRFGFNLPDRQLACAPVKSQEGTDYFNAMKCAANFAWNNRQIIMHLTEKSLIRSLGISNSELGFELLYDVAHNIAKMEEHNIDGRPKQLCVHRKGATRAFPPGKLIPERYRFVGQPVLIPGDMGRYSYIAAGSQKSMDETFGSSCHGAGRVASRHKAIKMGKGKDLLSEMRRFGVEIRAKGMKTIAEEMPYVYKDVTDVVDIMHNAGITKKVVKLKPFGVIKG
ncbi:MAG: RtcB family protein [Bacteroidetes bacterium]|nr:RtcB family protein [Bacteroidota bacterium]